MKLPDEKIAPADAQRMDAAEAGVQGFGAVDAEGMMSKLQGNAAEESQEYIAFSAAEARREVKRVGVEVSKGLDTTNTGRISTVDDIGEDSNTINASEETKAQKKTIAEGLRNFSEYTTKGNDMHMSQEDIGMEDKSNEAININDNDISITENSCIDAGKPKLNGKNRTCSVELDAQPRSPAITQTVNNKMVFNRDSGCKGQSLDTEMETDRCNREERSAEIRICAMRQAKSMNDIHDVDCENQEKKIPPKKSNVDDKKSCMIVSTIPKCDRFDIPGQDIIKQESQKSACLIKSRTLSVDDLKEITNEAENGKNTATSCSEVSSPRRTKIYRSQSEFRDFEESSFKKQRKHLTSHAQDFAFALNLNLPAKQPRGSTMRDADHENSRVTLTGRSGACCYFTNICERQTRLS